jgi:uncharacterized membrane protein YhaH (DUF805 family)
MGIAALLGFLITVGIYIFFCYCAKVVCEKCGQQPGVLIWIPILQGIPLLKAAGMAAWMLLLMLFVPVVNLVVFIMMWVKICQARHKSGWLVLLIFVPVADIVFLPYLAFSE